MKAVSMVAAVVFIAITISAMALIYQSGVPIIQRMQSSASLDRMASSFSELDSTIQRVASEGNGSRRVLDFDTGEGRLSIDTDNDNIEWQLDAEYAVIRPRSARFLGNVAYGSNLEASLEEVTYQSQQAHLLENDHLMVYLRRLPTDQTYSIHTLLMDIYQKDINEFLPMSSLNISLDGDPSSTSGTGRTEAERLGQNLPHATVTAFMDSTYADYSVDFTLESGADFLTIEADVL